MNLDEAQRKTVAEWIGQGLKLSEIQTRLVSDLSLTMTYMEVRLLVDDLKLPPKDPEPVKPVESPLSAAGAADRPTARAPPCRPPSRRGRRPRRRSPVPSRR